MKGAGAREGRGDHVETTRGGAKTKGKGHHDGEANGNASQKREGKYRPGLRSSINGLLFNPGLPAALKSGHI